MVRNPEGQEDAFIDGVQPEDVERIIAETAESDPLASKEALVNWESNEFGNKGDDPISDEEQFRLIQ